MKKRDLLIFNITSLIIFVLELMPKSSALILAYLNEDGIKEYSKVLYPFYDPMLFGNGNFVPLVILLLTILINVVLVVNLWKENFFKLSTVAILIVLIVLMFVIQTILLGFKILTIYSIIIFILLILELCYISYLKLTNKG